MTAVVTSQPRQRDYSLAGDSTREAVESGLVGSDWYRSPISSDTLKALAQRTDGPAIRDTIIWLGALAVSGIGGVLAWGTWWCVPFFVVYGVLYGSGGDSRWHECGHSTAFRTKWMNDAVYQIGSFMVMRSPVAWRWSHVRHHADTLIVGRDPEIALMRPPRFWRQVSNLLGLYDSWGAMRAMVRHAAGRLSVDEASYVPAARRPRVHTTARIWVLIYAATIASAIATTSILPLMLIGLPRLYGQWHIQLTGFLQHGALADNVLDHRQNTRTVYMNPISRFIYWNMNYHAEHHMFPMVPYHRLPELHALLKDDFPPPATSIWAGYRDMLPVVWRQRRNPEVHLQLDVPSGTS
ncbi:MAG: fatty acid desaturase family protein [Ilumatobacteraceae bacterium]